MKKKLVRSHNKIVSGVIGGLADYFEHDPVIWRLGFVCFLIFTGLMPGVLLYAISIFIMPSPKAEQYFTYRVVDENID